MKKLFFLLALIMLACNPEQIQEPTSTEIQTLSEGGQLLSHTTTGTALVDKYVEPENTIINSGDADVTIIPGSGLESRSPEYCACEYIDIEFPVINGVTNWVHVYDGVVGANVRFLFQIYLWQEPYGGWFEVLSYGDHTFIAEYCKSDPYEDGHTLPRKIFGRADYFCNNRYYLMVSSMYAKDASGNWYYCSTLERTFDYTTDVSGTKCSPNR